MQKEFCPEEIRAAKREYHRKWRAEHPEQIQAAQARFWQRKAQQMRGAVSMDDEERKGEAQ